jgi:hypothetical protein
MAIRIGRPDGARTGQPETIPSGRLEVGGGLDEGQGNEVDAQPRSSTGPRPEFATARAAPRWARQPWV